MKLKTLLLLICIYLVGVTQLFSQKIVEVHSSVVSLTEDISFDNDHIWNKPKLDTIELKGDGPTIVKNPKFQVISGDLILRFDLGEVETGYFSIKLNKIENGNKDIPILPDRVYGDVGSKIPASKNNRMHIRLANVGNYNPLILTGRIKIQFTVVQYNYFTAKGKYLRIPVLCDGKEIPSLKLFNFKRGKKGKRGRALSLIGIGLAAGTYWLGEKVEDTALDIYKDEYKRHETKEEAEEDYNRANNKYKDSKTLKTTGLVIGGVTLAWTVVQQLMQWERKETYKCKCQNDCAFHQKEEDGIKLELFGEPPMGPGYNSLSYVGMGVRLSF